MADISQLEVNGTTYDICDATARNSLSNYVLKSGDTMTGTLNIQSQVIDRDGDLPESNQYSGYCYIKDKDNEVLAYLSGYRFTNGQTGLQIYGTGEVNGSSVSTGLRMGVDSQGNSFYALTSPQAFREAAGALPSVTGDHTFEGIYTKYWGSYQVSSATSATSISTNIINMRDASANGIYTNQLRFGITGENRIYSCLVARKGSGDTLIQNQLGPIVGPDGSYDYTVTAPQAFRYKINAIGCSNAETQKPILSTLSAAYQCWALRSFVTNPTNTTYRNHEIGLIVNNTGISMYDWGTENGTVGGTKWTYSTNPTSTTTVSDVITVASGRTIGSVTYRELNGIAFLTLTVSGFTATSGATQTVGTIKSGKRPVQTTYGFMTTTSGTYCRISSAGEMVIYWNTNPSTTSAYTLSFTYLLA